MRLSDSYKFAYRIVKENRTLYRILRTLMREDIKFAWGVPQKWAKERRFEFCLERTICAITQHPIVSMYNQMTIPKQVIPILGKDFNVKVFSLIRGVTYTVTMKCTGYDPSRNKLLFGKTGQAIDPHRLSMVDDENFNAVEFVINLLKVRSEDYIIEKKLNIRYLCERYPHIFDKRALLLD